MKYTDRITFNPRQCGGRPCIRGMRIRVKDVLDLLAAGVSEKEVLEDFPYLEAEDIRACLEYAAQELDHPVLVAERSGWMQFLVDAQLPPALARWLTEAGHPAKHVEDAGLREAEDAPIWDYALQQRVVLLTKDEDFTARVKQSGQAPMMVWLRIGNCSNRALQAWLMPLLPKIVAELERGQRFIEVR